MSTGRSSNGCAATPAPLDVPGGRREHHRRGGRRLLSRAEGAEIVGVGIGAAGFVAADRNTVVFAPICPGVRSRCGTPWHWVPGPVTVDNDANAAAWASTGSVRPAAKSHPHDDHPRNRNRRRHRRQRSRRAWAPRHGGEYGHIRSFPTGCAAVREPRLLGAVRQRERPGARGSALLLARSPIVEELKAYVGDVDNLTGPAITESAHRGDAAAVELIRGDRGVAWSRYRQPRCRL